MSERRSVSDTWLWRALFLLGWPTVIGLVRFAAAILTSDTSAVPVGTVYLAVCAVLVVLTWAIASRACTPRHILSTLATPNGSRRSDTGTGPTGIGGAAPKKD